jgi:hypothetical protein
MHPSNVSKKLQTITVFKNLIMAKSPDNKKVAGLDSRLRGNDERRFHAVQGQSTSKF